MNKSIRMIGMSALVAGLGLLAAPAVARAQDSVFVTATGNVGIGTASPGARLEVSGGEVRLPPGQGGAGFTHFNFSGNGQNYIRGTTVLADNGGNVGIGTTSPAAKLEVSGGEVRFPPGSGLGGFTHFNFSGDGKNYIRGITVLADNGGWVGIGTAAPVTKLHVSGSSVSTTAPTKILVQETNSTTTPRELLEIQNNGGAVFILDDTSVAQRWAQGTQGINFVMDEQANAGTELVLTNTGNLTIAGMLTQGSDRSTKRDVMPVQPGEILAKVATLPLATWSRKTDDASVRHLGPMAQDFAAVFGLGEDDRHIALGDMAGVSLASIQALYGMVTEIEMKKDAAIETLRHENAGLADRVRVLESLVTSLVKERESTARTEPAP